MDENETAEDGSAVVTQLKISNGMLFCFPLLYVLPQARCLTDELSSISRAMGESGPSGRNVYERPHFS
ncbi:unnamed protein product [Lasius platythorax]|uniref:Uncharacterized protein n=1 Tax=Lasius platythorax TaxID=488582 RepID=A0AAV2NUG8_9HYME